MLVLVIRMIYLLGQKKLILVEQYLEKTPLEESHGDDLIVDASPSPKSMNLIPVETLDLVPPYCTPSPVMFLY